MITQYSDGRAASRVCICTRALQSQRRRVSLVVHLNLVQTSYQSVDRGPCSEQQGPRCSVQDILYQLRFQPAPPLHLGLPLDFNRGLSTFARVDQLCKLKSIHTVPVR